MAANPRPRSVPLYKEPFFFDCTTHTSFYSILLDTPRFLSPASLRHEVAPRLSALVFSYLARYLFFSS